MAKRFTDTSKWDKIWFMDLSIHQKLLWIYLCDHCTHAGIFEKNFKIATCYLGFDISQSSLDSMGDKIIEIGDNKIFIPSFIEFQYGELKDNNRVHLSVLDSLKKYKIDVRYLKNKPLTSPLQGRKDKDKDKYKEKDKEKDKEPDGPISLKKYAEKILDEKDVDGLKDIAALVGEKQAIKLYEASRKK